LLAWPVKNIAAPTHTLWYTATIRYPPNNRDVGPGCDPYNSAIDRAIGSVTPPLRAPFDGMIVASTASVAASAYVIPTEVVPNPRTNNSAIRRANPVFNNAREIKNAVSTSHTIGSEYPASALCIVNPPTSADATTPIKTIAPPGTGCKINPATVAANTPNSRHASTFTPAGCGSKYAIAKYTATTGPKLLNRPSTDGYHIIASPEYPVRNTKAIGKLRIDSSRFLAHTRTDP
jgi:hypothetical protein